MAGQRLRSGRLQYPLGERRQVRLEGAEALPGVGGTRQRAELDGRVAEQQAEQLATGVPTRSGHCDPLRRHAHDYTEIRIFMQIRVWCGRPPRPGDVVRAWR